VWVKSFKYGIGHANSLETEDFGAFFRFRDFRAFSRFQGFFSISGLSKYDIGQELLRLASAVGPPPTPPPAGGPPLELGRPLARPQEVRRPPAGGSTADMSQGGSSSAGMWRRAPATQNRALQPVMLGAPTPLEVAPPAVVNEVTNLPLIMYLYCKDLRLVAFTCKWTNN